MCEPMAGGYRAGQHVLGRDRNIPPKNRSSIDGSVVDQRREGSSGTGKGDPVGWTFVHGFPPPCARPDVRLANQAYTFYQEQILRFTPTLELRGWTPDVSTCCRALPLELICGFNAHENSDVVELRGIHFRLWSNQHGIRCYLSRISALWNFLLLRGCTTPENDSSALRKMGLRRMHSCVAVIVGTRSMHSRRCSWFRHQGGREKNRTLMRFSRSRKTGRQP